MCGFAGIIGLEGVAGALSMGLQALQHRGQDAAGIVTMQGTTCHMHKARGMVRDVFRTRNMRALPGNIGIGHGVVCLPPAMNHPVKVAERIAMEPRAQMQNAFFFDRESVETAAVWDDCGLTTNINFI